MRGLQSLIQELRGRKLTISFAESCTGGLLSSSLTEHAGISDIFLGSVVSYANQVKFDLLGVKPQDCMQWGAVSEAVALQMVQGACKAMKSDCAIAVTGVAGPDGGSPEKPVGTVWIAIRGPGFERATKKFFSGNRREIQKQACETAYQLLNEAFGVR